MTTVTLSIASREAVTSRFLRAASDHSEGHFISFATPSLLFGTLTAKRRDLLAAMQGGGPLAASGLACRVGRKVKGVQADLRSLLNAGIVEKTPEGEFVFPYDALRRFFMACGVTAASPRLRRLVGAASAAISSGGIGACPQM